MLGSLVFGWVMGVVVLGDGLSCSCSQSYEGGSMFAVYCGCGCIGVASFSSSLLWVLWIVSVCMVVVRWRFSI